MEPVFLITYSQMCLLTAVERPTVQSPRPDRPADWLPSHVGGNFKIDGKIRKGGFIISLTSDSHHLSSYPPLVLHLHLSWLWMVYIWETAQWWQRSWCLFLFFGFNKDSTCYPLSAGACSSAADGNEQDGQHVSELQGVPHSAHQGTNVSMSCRHTGDSCVTYAVHVLCF